MEEYVLLGLRDTGAVIVPFSQVGIYKKGFKHKILQALQFKFTG